jgi:hypothetical protein
MVRYYIHVYINKDVKYVYLNTHTHIIYMYIYTCY